MVFRQLRTLYKDEQGQNAVEVLVITAVLVSALAAALHGLLPNLGNGFMEMAKEIGGPVP